METPTDLPFALYKAQVALGLQTLGLFKAARQRWFELGAQLLADDVARTESALADLQGAENWQAFGALLPSAFWQANQRGVTMLQGVVQTAIANQSSFATEYQRAVLEWQQASVQALSAARNAMPAHTMLQDMLSTFGAPTNLFVRQEAAPQSPVPPRRKGNGELARAAS